MLFDHLRDFGIALLCVALSLATWKVLGRDAGMDSGFGMPAGEVTIPVEIVETGEAPQFREIRVSR